MPTVIGCSNGEARLVLRRRGRFIVRQVARIPQRREVKEHLLTPTLEVCATELRWLVGGCIRPWGLRWHRPRYVAIAYRVGPEGSNGMSKHGPKGTTRSGTNR